jgi:hypothetical protein
MPRTPANIDPRVDGSHPGQHHPPKLMPLVAYSGLRPGVGAASAGDRRHPALRYVNNDPLKLMPLVAYSGLRPGVGAASAGDRRHPALRYANNVINLDTL